MKTLETDRLILRQWKLDDLDDLYDYAKNSDFGILTGWKPHESKDESSKTLNCFIEDNERWAIELKSTGKAIGSIRIRTDENKGKYYAKSISYVLSEDYCNNGYMTETVKKIIEYIFKELNVDIITAFHYPHNHRSKRMLEKCGFEYEGIIKNGSTIYDGQVFDSVVYSLLRENWEIINHYDLLIDENNDPVRDNQIGKDYMDKWDGQVFFDLLQLDKDKTVLEIGVGTGRLAIKTIPKCKHFTGIDMSSKTIERAKVNLAEFENKTLICDDFMALEFNRQFDVIYSSLSFMHIKEKQKAINKIANILADNGRFVISISKDQSEELDFGTRKIFLYPDTPEETRKMIENAKLKFIKEIETEFAWILVARKV